MSISDQLTTWKITRQDDLFNILSDSNAIWNWVDDCKRKCTKQAKFFVCSCTFIIYYLHNNIVTIFIDIWTEGQSHKDWAPLILCEVINTILKMQRQICWCYTIFLKLNMVILLSPLTCTSIVKSFRDIFLLKRSSAFCLVSQSVWLIIIWDPAVSHISTLLSSCREKCNYANLA